MNTNEKIDVEEILKQCENDYRKYSNIIEAISTGRILSSTKKFFFPTYPNFRDNFGSNIKALINLIRTEKDPILKKCISCILCAFFGDASGAFCEFAGPSHNNKNSIFKGKNVFGEVGGCVTDDSEMAMSMAYGIMDNPQLSIIKSEYNYYYYGVWLYSGPSDMGNTTRMALKYFKYDTYDPSKIDFKKDIERMYAAYNSGSKANGFLMRFSPFVAWFYYRNEEKINNILKSGKYDDLFILYNEIKAEAQKDNFCTHTNLELPGVSAMYTILGLYGICGYSSQDIFSLFESFINYLLTEKKSDKNISNELSFIKKVKDTIYDFKKPDFDFWNYFTEKESVYKQMGYYYHGFKLLLYFILNLQSYSSEPGKPWLRKISEEVCDLGGDTDTNLAIIGGVLGAIHGTEDLLENKEFEEVIGRWGMRLLYSPAIMYLYVKFLQKSKNKQKWPKYNVGRIFLNMLYDANYVSNFPFDNFNDIIKDEMDDNDNNINNNNNKVEENKTQLL